MYEITETQNVTQTKNGGVLNPYRIPFEFFFSKNAIKGKPLRQSSIVSTFQQTLPYQLKWAI